MPTEIVFAPEAQTDLITFNEYIQTNATPARALDYVTRLHTFCLGLAAFPMRGAPRPDIDQDCASFDFNDVSPSPFT